MAFNTLAERQAWIMASTDNMLSFALNFNPRGVYDVIQRVWPGEFQLLENGAENTPFNLAKMHDFVSDKAALSANPPAFMAQFMQMVPASDKFNSNALWLNS